MIPYPAVPSFRIGPFLFSPAAILVASAILTGYFLFLRRARKDGLDSQVAANFAAILLIGGLLGGHWLKLLYLPDVATVLRERPMLLLVVWNGQASFGGILGGSLAGLAYLCWRRKSPLAYLDSFARVFPYAWLLGRMHCFLVHDHPGIRTTHWLGTRYPDGVRFDLAFLEILFVLGLLPVLVWIGKRPRRDGALTAIFLIAYGVFRFGLDQLHVDAVRYASLSVDQWAALLTIGAGICLRLWASGGISWNCHLEGGNACGA